MRKTIIPKKGEVMPYYEAAYLAKRVLALIILGTHEFEVRNSMKDYIDYEVDDRDPARIVCHGFELEIGHDGTFPRTICGIYDISNDTRHYILVTLDDHFSDYHQALLGQLIDIKMTDKEMAEWKEEYLNLQTKGKS